MPRRKSKSKKGPPEKAYKLISYQEVLSKEQKYLNHIGNLRKCLKAVEESTDLQREIEAKELLQQKWLDYVDCNPLPKPYIPSDIRLTVDKIKLFENASVEATINWLLSVDERSILAQDIFAKDLTRQTLSKTIKPNFGYEYDDHVEFSLSILKRIQYFLLNEVELKKCSLSILKDIKELRWDIQNEIQEFFNRFTYRILSSENSYMNSVDACTSDYSYEGKHFQIHIWCLKNVPIRFNQMDEPYMIARMEGIKISLQIPAEVLELNFTIRAIHLDFDHVSEKAISAFLELIELHRHLNAEIEELPDSLLNEWQMQLNIQKRIRNEMTKKRLEYEEQLRAYIEQQEAAKRPNAKEKDENEKGVKKKKIAKPTKEPPLLTNDMYPDVFEDFLQEEQSQFEEFINLAYNPDYMDLGPDEINLKKYSILGGIYQIYKVDKPIHFDFQSFDITNHKNGSELVIDNDALIKPFLKRSRSKMRTSVFANERTLSNKIQEFKPVPDCPWYNLIIELPAYLCDWGEPIVCQYATIDKIKPKEGAIQKEPSFAAKELVKKGSVSAPTDLEATAQVIDLQPVKKDFTFSPSILNIQRPSHENFLRTSLSNMRFGKFYNLMEIPARDDQGVLNIHDFPLTNYLKKQQIRDIQRHVVPRILSSFKFPKEIREDEILAENQKKSKGKGGVLVRKRGNVGAAETTAVREKGFYFGPKQSSPERVIALFSPVEDIRLFETIDDELGEEEEEDEYRVRKKRLSNEPKTFIDLLRITNNIKWGYKLRIRKMLDLKPFPLKKKIRLVNKRIDVLVKRIRRGSFAETAAQTSATTESHTSLQRIEDADAVAEDTNILPEKEEKKAPEEQQQQQQQKPKKKKKIVEKEEPQEEEPLETYRYDCWTTKYILKSDFNREKHQIEIQTDRLGYFGLAFKMYEHFPFKFWKLEPNPEDPENELIFTLDTQFVRCILNISEKGIKGCVTEPSTKFVRNPKMYLVLEEPISDYIEFKRMFKEKFLNIFADNDACYYIENGYFCQKHLATELHTYNCMAINCTQIKFSFSQWNRLSKRRDILLKFLQYQDLEENIVEVRITPEEAWFVETTELCSDDVDIINLQYNLTWRNLTTCSDLNYLVNSMYLAAHELRCKNPKLIHFVRSLLSEIRPLSFS